MQAHAAPVSVQQGGQDTEHGAGDQDQPVQESVLHIVVPEGQPQDGRQVDHRNNKGDNTQRSTVELVMAVKSKGDIRKECGTADQCVNHPGNPDPQLPLVRLANHQHQAHRRGASQHIAKDGKDGSPGSQGRILGCRRFKQVLDDQQKAGNHRKPEIPQFSVAQGFLGAEAD